MITGCHIAARIGAMSPVLVPGVQMWSAETEIEELDGTTAEDEGYDNPAGGIQKCTVQLTLVMDITAGSFAPISVGTEIGNLKLYADVSAPTPIYTIPVARVFRSTFKGEVKGRVTYDCTIKSVGAFTEAEPN